MRVHTFTIYWCPSMCLGSNDDHYAHVSSLRQSTARATSLHLLRLLLLHRHRTNSRSLLSHSRAEIHFCVTLVSLRASDPSPEFLLRIILLSSLSSAAAVLLLHHHRTDSEPILIPFCRTLAEVHFCVTFSFRSLAPHPHAHLVRTPSLHPLDSSPAFVFVFSEPILVFFWRSDIAGTC